MKTMNVTLTKIQVSALRQMIAMTFLHRLANIIDHERHAPVGSMTIADRMLPYVLKFAEVDELPLELAKAFQDPEAQTVTVKITEKIANTWEKVLSAQYGVTDVPGMNQDDAASVVLACRRLGEEIKTELKMGKLGVAEVQPNVFTNRSVFPS